MSMRKLLCEQAIFTSTRTATGEGYRIVAASRGLRPDAKQAITRHSPSHEALCWSPDTLSDGDGPRYAGSFYALPDDQLCVAYSRFAGAEQTGRGGHRVYTVSVVFGRCDFRLCGYNPFTVLRAMAAANMTKPTLDPPAVLPTVELAFDATPSTHNLPSVSSLFSPEWCAYLLRELSQKRQFVVNLAQHWSEAAETLLLGLPGEARANVSFSTGLRYSVTRTHDLSFLSDDRGVTKARIAGRPVELIEPLKRTAPQPEESAWFSFVRRHWENDDITKLAKRTSIPLGDLHSPECERIARLYNEIDNVQKSRTKSLLAAAAAHLDHEDAALETEIAAELVVSAQDTLVSRFSVRTWEEVRAVWPALCSIWNQSTEGRLFAQPLIERSLEVAGKAHPLVAAMAALELARNVQANSRSGGHDALIDRVLTRLADWARNAPDDELEKLAVLCERWRAMRPHCPIISELQQYCADPAKA